MDGGNLQTKTLEKYNYLQPMNRYVGEENSDTAMASFTAGYRCTGLEEGPI